MHDELDQVIERCDEQQLIAMQIIVNEVSTALDQNVKESTKHVGDKVSFLIHVFDNNNTYES